MRYLMRYFVKLFPGSPFKKYRTYLWRSVGFNVSKTANIQPTAILICCDISIEPKTFIGDEVMLTGGMISIGARCDLAPRVIVHAGSHTIGDIYRRAGNTYSGEIQIGDGTWIGTGAVILAGSKIGKGCMIGAGSVVKDGEYPDNCLLLSVPAKVARLFE